MSYRRLLYSIVLYVIFPFVILRLFWRSRKNRAYRQRISERLGLFKLTKKSNKSVIWVHAVSVGETIAAKPLIDALLDQYPDYQLLITSTTPTGSEMVKKLFQNKVAHVYFPYDLPEIVARFLNRTKPQLCIIVETEIWPNLYAACTKRQIPIMLANARLSARSTTGYLKIKGLVEETLKRIDVIAVRSEDDAERFKTLGALEQQIIVAGNIKFDLNLNQAQVEKGKLRKSQWGIKRPVWVAASTHEGEEQQLLQIHSRLLKNYPDLILVLIPRHLERFDEVFELCHSQPDLIALRHSQQKNYNNCNANIILGDTIGEMQSWYATANVVFMGGSLVSTGGHNPLEATLLDKPVISGPHTFNFEDIYPILSEAGLCWICDDSDQIETQLMNLLDHQLGTELGTEPDKELDDQLDMEFNLKVKNIMQQHGGVTTRLMLQIKALLSRVSV